MIGFPVASPFLSIARSRDDTNCKLYRKQVACIWLAKVSNLTGFRSFTKSNQIHLLVALAPLLLDHLLHKVGGRLVAGVDLLVGATVGPNLE